MRASSIVISLAFVALAACGGDDGGGDDDGTPPPDGGGTGEICGGFAGRQCADTHYCDWDDDSCGAADGSGTCQPRPEVCADDAPVCGCNGTSYLGACAAAADGTDVSAAGGC